MLYVPADTSTAPVTGIVARPPAGMVVCPASPNGNCKLSGCGNSASRHSAMSGNVPVLVLRSTAVPVAISRAGNGTVRNPPLFWPWVRSTIVGLATVSGGRGTGAEVALLLANADRVGPGDPFSPGG